MKRALLLLAATTCTPRLPPVGTLEGVRPLHLRDVPPEALGETVSVSVRENAEVRRWFHGEILACDQQAIYMLIHAATEGSYFLVPWRVVHQVRLGEVPGNALLPTWTTLGTLSAISHGYFAGISIPIWLGAGIPISVAGRDARPRAENCDELRASARFPQGLPGAFREAHFSSRVNAAPPSSAPSDGQGNPALLAPWQQPDAGAQGDAETEALPSEADAGRENTTDAEDGDARVEEDASHR